MSERPIDEENVRRVRLGHGANCSSIGSVVDTLFATAVGRGGSLRGRRRGPQSEEVRGGPASARRARRRTSEPREGGGEQAMIVRYEAGGRG